MRGHEALIAMRVRGKRPRAVAVETDLSPARNLAKNWPELGTGFAHVAIDPSDQLHELDLRCMVSMMVHVSGTDVGRVEAVFEAIKAAGASRVVAAVSAGDREVIRMFDSEEAFVWPI